MKRREFFESNGANPKGRGLTITAGGPAIGRSLFPKPEPAHEPCCHAESCCGNCRCQAFYEANAIMPLSGLVIAIAMAVLSVLYAGECLAGSPDIGFLQRNFSARAAAMGGAYSTMEGDSLSALYNPACLGLLSTAEVAAASSRSDFDQKEDAIAFSFRHGNRRRAFGGPFALRDEISGIEGRDAFGNLTGTFSDRQQVIGYAAGGSNAFLERRGLLAGFVVKSYSEGVMGSSASGAGLDIGFLKDLSKGRRASFVMRNIIGGMSWSGASARSESFAREAAAGYSMNATKGARIAAELTANGPGGKKISASIGAEKKVSEKAVIRAGLDGGRPAFGVGLRLSESVIDYAFVRRDDSDLHRVSAVFYTGKK